MIVKSYFADSVEAALAEASRQLGPDAVLLYSRESLPETRHLGRYEVVFGLAAESTSSVGAATAGSTGMPAGHPTGNENPDRIEWMMQELNRLRRELERVEQRLETRMGEPAPATVRGPAHELLAELASRGVPGELLDRLASRLSARPAAQLEREQWQAILGEELSHAVPLEPVEPQGKPVAFVGPPGSGKTLTLIKLAIRWGVLRRRPVQIFSLDGWRIAAGEQLRCYAGLIGASFQLVDPPFILPSLVEPVRNKALVLIDTPGYSLRELNAAAEVISALERCGERDVILTLRASAKPSDLERAMEAYQRFRPNRLIFTHLDETGTPGTILQLAALGLPISFLAYGPGIPEDLVEATGQSLASLLLGDGSVQACSLASVSSPQTPGLGLGKAAAA